MRLAGPFVPLLLAAIAAPLPAQQQNVTLVVLNAANQPPQPVRAVRVSLSYLDSGTVVTDAQQVTNGDGEALLVVSPGVVQRGDLRIEVTGAANLVIWQPADGQLASLGARERIILLPKGSPALLGPVQIEAMLHRTLLQVNSLQKQVRALQSQAASPDNQKQSQQQNVDAALAEFAQANGFPSDQVRQQVQIWAQNIQLQSDQATAEQRALAEFALKNYAAAAQTFNQAADTAGSAIDATEAEAAGLEKALLDKVRGQLKQLISDRKQAAAAYQLSLQYHHATQSLESAATTAQEEYRKHPDDTGFHELWLAALLAAADARRIEGEDARASQTQALLTQSVDDLQFLTREYGLLGDRLQVAAADLDLGATLHGEGIRSSGDQSADLLNQSAQAIGQALQIYTRADHPQNWAKTEYDLGLTLMSEGERGRAEKSVDLLDQAIQAFRNALEVYTRTGQPVDWALTENALGSALDDEAIRVSGGRTMDLLGQAAAAYQNELEVYTRSSNPQNWANAQNNLGITLMYQAEHSGPDKAASFYDQAVQAYQSALAVYTKTDVPQDWARTQANISFAMQDEADLTGGDKGLALLGQSAQALRSALEVYTKADLPQDWGTTQDNLGAVLVDEGMSTSGQKGLDLLEEAVQAFRNSLEVRTRSELPQDWAFSEANLGYALWAESTRMSGDQAVPLLEQSAEASRSALEVYTRATLPQNWARTQYFLALTLADEAARVGANKAAPLLDQAAQALQSTLDVYTQADNPRDWANIQLTLAEINLRAAHFDACLRQTGPALDGLLPPQQLTTRDTLRLACQWGAGNKAAALENERSLATRTGTISKGGDFSGTMHFLSTLPAFSTGRAYWMALFTSLQNGDGAGMTAALHQLEPFLRE